MISHQIYHILYSMCILLLLFRGNLDENLLETSKFEISSDFEIYTVSSYFHNYYIRNIASFLQITSSGNVITTYMYLYCRIFNNNQILLTRKILKRLC